LATSVNSRHHRSTLQGPSRIASVALLVVAAAFAGPGWSSPGAPTGRIVYVHDASDSGPVRWVVAEADLDRGRCRRLLTLPPSATAVAVSPDARAAAVTFEGMRTSELRVVTFASGRTRTLRRAQLGLDTVVWAPDGRRLAYVDRRGLHLIGADGRGDRLVARSAAGWAAWSPDGTRLAFASTTGDGRAGTLRTTLDVITAAGRGRRTLFVDPAPYGSQPDPVWSPDGSRISFIGSGPAGIGEVWTMAADGTQKRRLTTSVAPPRGVPKFGSYPGPWSPDGKWLAFGRKWALATMNAEGDSVSARCRLPFGVGFSGGIWIN
jgi:Tol biopolymer transport system component